MTVMDFVLETRSTKIICGVQPKVRHTRGGLSQQVYHDSFFVRTFMIASQSNGDPRTWSDTLRSSIEHGRVWCCLKSARSGFQEVQKFEFGCPACGCMWAQRRRTSSAGVHVTMEGRWKSASASFRTVPLLVLHHEHYCDFHERPSKEFC
jgi:hypothetical protein